ncbi:MAG TPA: mannose-1-phosphate guanylyltransferase/mannose-6-phosphate isomerase [Xanthobacteraceae bacterium]|nr:mannose-1-phosphate guanylyltransferase/mannose-6-phosphate isomerase [Xanthobacteraceae bacterium]
MAERTARIVPVLLSGGAGARLWPLSRESYPKQLLRLVGDKTLMQQTALRVCDRTRFAPPLVVANAEHRFVIAEQLRAVGIHDATIVLEPVGRSTAPAAAVAALAALAQDPDAVILLLPVDHLVRDVGAFQRAVDLAMDAAANGLMVLFGIQPTSAATGYGYILAGDEIAPTSEVCEVIGFVEKPDADTARRFVVSNHHLWNSGMFLLPAGVFVGELERLAPDVLAAARDALNSAACDLDFLRLARAPFEGCRSISIDYAVMENTDKSAVVRAEFDWSDVGSWSALWDVSEKDASGNVALGDVIAEDASRCYLHGDGPLVAALGVDNLVVTATADVVLVASRDRDQDVKKLVDRLKSNGHRAATQTQRVHRPWGSYQSLHRGERFQVKCITVNPGGKLSLQKHFHRAEHWVVVNGTALVTRDDDQVLLRENESIFVPLGAIHRLENPGKLPLNIIEVQSGAYLEEDDIVRMDDIYQRQAS